MRHSYTVEALILAAAIVAAGWFSAHALVYSVDRQYEIRQELEAAALRQVLGGKHE